MRGNFLTVVTGLVLIAFATLAATQSKSKLGRSGTGVDRAHLQKIWDGWSTLDPANVARFYAQGPHTFFDIAPLKYSSWEEYQANVKNVLADYSSAKFTVNDDALLHPAGNYVWATATVKEEMKHKNGKVEMGSFRWTVVFEKQAGGWLIVHEHVSVPAA
jgi:ketosteroid isomerase-like protein